VMVETMKSNSNEDSEDGNSKNKVKATMKPKMTTEEGERCQSRRDNRFRKHRRPCDSAIVPAAALSRHTSGSCCVRVERSELSTIHGNR
jgi:hypothetical protein